MNVSVSSLLSNEGSVTDSGVLLTDTLLMVVLTLHGWWHMARKHNTFYSGVCTCTYIQERVSAEIARPRSIQLSVMVIIRKCYDPAYKSFPGFA